MNYDTILSATVELDTRCDIVLKAVLMLNRSLRTMFLAGQRHRRSAYRLSSMHQGGVYQDYVVSRRNKVRQGTH